MSPQPPCLSMLAHACLHLIPNPVTLPPYIAHAHVFTSFMAICNLRRSSAELPSAPSPAIFYVHTIYWSSCGTAPCIPNPLPSLCNSFWLPPCLVIASNSAQMCLGLLCLLSGDLCLSYYINVQALVRDALILPYTHTHTLSLSLSLSLSVSYMLTELIAITGFIPIILRA
jgi:hypothetical protein